MNQVADRSPGAEDTANAQETDGVSGGPSGSGSVAAMCPLCGDDTGIERNLDPELGPLTLGEFETLVRNEWRRRLGPRSYPREHSLTIIRALFTYALAPESPVRSTVLQQLIWWELTALGAVGLDSAAVRYEFHQLVLAVRHVLKEAGLPSERTARIIGTIEAKLRDTLDGTD